MLLLDTSVLVALLTAEAASTRCRNFVQARYGQLTISAWAITEFSAALSMKQRLSLLTDMDRLATLRLFDEMFDLTLQVIDVERRDFEEASSLCDDHELGLRAPDALHLAVAARQGATLVTLDKKLFKAAAILGCKPEMP
jgi:uncharacterized protein